MKITDREDCNTTSTETDELITYPWTKKLHRVMGDSVTVCGEPTDGKEVIEAENPLEVIYLQTTPKVKPCEECFEVEYHELHQLYLKGYTPIEITTPDEELIAPLPWSVNSLGN